MRLVPLNSIKANSVLGQDVLDENGRILLRKGTELPDNMLSRLRDNEITMLYIEDEYSDLEINDIVSPQIRMQTVSAFKTTMKNAQKELMKEKKEVSNQSFNKKIDYKRREKYYEDISSIIDRLVDELTGNKSSMVCLVDIKNMSNYAYQHSVQVAILSLVIGLSAGLSRNKLKDLAMAGLLHDIGKVLVTEEENMMTKKMIEDIDNLDPSVEFYKHTTEGYNYLKKNPSFSPVVRIPILEHHERVDGRGYPNQKLGTQIHQHSKIIAIANMYDLLTSGMGEENYTPNEALEYIMGQAGKMFDFELVNIFAKKVIPFTIGTRVLLSNGQKASVSGYNLNIPLRPTVKLLENLKEVDLSKELNLTIEQVVFD